MKEKDLEVNPVQFKQSEESPLKEERCLLLHFPIFPQL